MGRLCTSGSQRVETKVGQGIEFTILNPQAETKLNALQKMWGAALIDVYPGDPYFSRLAGWKLLRELGWPARLYHRALVKAIMLEERAQLSGWDTLTAALGLSGSITGSWTNTVALRKTEFEVPPADRSRIAAADTAGGRRHRLRRYRKEVVEPALFSATEAEIARELANPRHSTYAALHPGRGPVVGVLQGHGWGPATLMYYKVWVRLRLTLRCEGGCPVCGSADGTAEHILTHGASRIPEGVPKSPLGPLWLLKTNLEAAKLRRNIRLVGQLLLAPDSRWDWLQEAARRGLDEAVASSGEEVEEEAHVDGRGDRE